jgi:hypothetical protein
MRRSPVMGFFFPWKMPLSKLREMVDREISTSLAASPVVRNSFGVIPFSFWRRVEELWDRATRFNYPGREAPGSTIQRKGYEFSKRLNPFLYSLDNNKKIILSNFFCGRVNKKFLLISSRGFFWFFFPRSWAQQKNGRRSTGPVAPKGPWAIHPGKGRDWKNLASIRVQVYPGFTPPLREGSHPFWKPVPFHPDVGASSVPFFESTLSSTKEGASWQRTCPGS